MNFCLEIVYCLEIYAVFRIIICTTKMERYVHFTKLKFYYRENKSHWKTRKQIQDHLETSVQ